MTIPANLFVEAPEVQDRALTKLDNDVNMWPEEIIQKFHERVPQAAGMNSMVKFIKKDDENGTATGSIVVNSPSAGMTVPLIIKEFTLYPLDVMTAKGKVLPLTPDYFDVVMSHNDVFHKIEEYPTYGGLGRFEDANLFNTIYPPSLGRYAYASAGYPMLDLISDNLDGTPVKNWLIENPSHAVAFRKHGHAPLLKKLANLKPVNMNEFSQGKHNLTPTIHVLKLEGANKYSLLSSSDQVFSPALTPMTREQAHSFMSTISDCVDDDMNEVDQNGEKLITADNHKHNADARLANTVFETPEEAKEYGHYLVKKLNGVSVEGVVITKVIDFNQKSVPTKIFIGKTCSTMQDNIWGVRIENSRFKPVTTVPRIGQTGTFVYQPDKSHALATTPVTIQSVTEDCGCLSLKVADLRGLTFKIKINPSLELKRIAKTGDGTYMLPCGHHGMKWVVMEGFDSITNSAESYNIKTANDTLSKNAVRISPNGFDYYAMKGVTKYAQAAGWDNTNMHSSQVKFLLACLGCGEEKVAQALKQASRAGYAELHGLTFAPTKQEKIASQKPDADKLVKAAASIKRNLLKEASYIDNSQTVDALLSLNFVTPDNISKFIGKIPHFKATISNLASSLIASRLGLKEIPEEAAAVAMSRLIEVVDGLEKLRATQEAGVG